MKTHTLDEVQDKLIGEIGTPARDKFEYELKMELKGRAIKQTIHSIRKKEDNNQLQKAANALLIDYTTDSDLTAFTDLR